MISVPESSIPRRLAAVVHPVARLWALLVGLAALIALAPPASAADVEPHAGAKATEAAAEAPHRPRIGLVLSGGGARGIAHIGVLKVLERERIPVDFIAGTSMGAIIGGLYASGMSAEEMERELVRINWAETLTISSRVDRRELSQRRKEEDFALSPLIDFGYRDGEFRAPTGAVSSRELELLLRRFTLPARHAKTFDELPIPFRAVATDLENGQQVVLADGDLALAMRSSMSIPGVFSPTEVNGRLLGDGMLVNNVPIDVARAMGADVLIVVNIGSPLASRESLGSAFGVAGQMINILTEQNVQRSLATLASGDVLIAPDLGKLTSADFDKAAEMVRRGEAGAESSVPRLAALALPSLDYVAWREGRRARLGAPVVLDHVAFQGTGYSNPARFESEFESKAGQPFDRRRAERDARRLAATDDYVRTDYRIVGDGDREGLVFDLEEKSWGPNFLRVGLTLDTDFRGDSSFNLALGHTRRWLTSNGSEWRNLVQIGETTILSTELYHPLDVNLGLRSDWFAAAYATLLRREVSLYNNANDEGLELARFDNKSGEVGFDIGRPWRNLGELRMGVQWLRYRTSPEDIGAKLVEAFQPQDFIERGLRLRVVVDQLDYAYFTTSGYRLMGEFAFGTRDGAGVDQAEFARVSVDAYGARTWGRQTFDALLLMQGTNPDGLSVVGRYTLGGFQRLSGYKKDQLNGNVASLMRLGWRMPLTGNVAFARALTVGATLEAGNTWRDLDSASWSDLRTGSSLYIGSDTGLGPVYLGLTYAPRGEFGLAFVVGRP